MGGLVKGGCDLLNMHTCNYNYVCVTEMFWGAARLDCISLAAKVAMVKYTSVALRAPKCWNWEK